MEKNQKQKQKAILIIIIAVAVVFISVYAVMRKVSKPVSTSVPENIPSTNTNPAALDADNIARGTVASFDGKILKVTTDNGERQLTVGETTPVFSVKNNKPVKGDASIIKAGKKINVQYDPKTMAATSILVL